MAKLKPPGPNASQAEKDAYRAKVKAMIDGDESDLAAIPDPKRETDPYITAQLAALKRMINESIDEDTGKPTKKGIIEFLFDVMNGCRDIPQTALDALKLITPGDQDAIRTWFQVQTITMDARLKAATTLIQFFHKKVPSTMLLTQQTNLADVDLSGLSPTELDNIQALLDKALTTSVPGMSKIVPPISHTEH
jgi:hypothetical protein